MAGLEIGVAVSPIPGQVIHGRYHVIVRLHQGGMGAIYEVMDSTLNIRCALKEMVPYPGTPGTALPQLRDQFQQEAQLLAELRHPNLPRVFDHFEEDGNAYLVMDFVNGRGLDEIIAEEGRLIEEEVLGWARQLMEALAYCHEHGVIHRDVKPQNVIITWQGQAMLVDFGLAKLVDPDDPRTRTVMRGLGTPEYAPPEQYITKEGRTDPRTDIYSLGATMYHVLSGERPPTVSERVVDPGVLVPVREVRDDIGDVTDRVLMKALALQPSQRFQSIDQMYYALFGVPLPQVKAGSTVPAGIDQTQLPGSPHSTALLPWLGTARLAIGRRLRLGLAALALLGLVAVTLLVADRVSMGTGRTAVATPTIFATVTATAVPIVPASHMPPSTTPAAAPSHTATPRSATSSTSSPTPLSTPTSTPTPSPTATPTPPPATAPEPVAPDLGRTYGNPIAFEWRGSLSAGWTYLVTAWHVGSGYVIQSGLLTDQGWTVDLPVERYGEWRWTVSVTQGERAMATSPEWSFWFDPYPGGGAREPTNTPPP
jgi:serine/threonine protein kinase